MENKIKTEVKKCKGCSLISVCDIHALVSNYIFMCPCRNCLVKMVCEDVCDEYSHNIVTTMTDVHFVLRMKEYRRETRMWHKRSIILREKGYE